MFSSFGKILVFLGFLLIFLGIIFLSGQRIPLFGRLPGDFHLKRGNFEFYFPFATSFLMSIILSIIFYIFSKFLK